MKTLAALATAALLAVPLAQQNADAPGPMAMQAGQHCPGMAAGSSAAMILEQKDALDLTEDQVRQLQELDNKAAGPHMSAAMAAWQGARDLLDADQPDLEAYEARLREAADHMVQSHTAMAAAGVAAREVLTPEQREVLADLPTQRHGMGMMQGGMMGDGMMGAGTMHGDAVGSGNGCPMMGGTSGTGGMGSMDDATPSIELHGTAG